jgi:hypothetical protein
MDWSEGLATLPPPIIGRFTSQRWYLPLGTPSGKVLGTPQNWGKSPQHVEKKNEGFPSNNYFLLILLK